MAPIFVVVTGTDTGVGKTFVTVALARAWSQAGRRVVAIKPIETGCREAPEEGEDGVALARATGQAEPRAALVRLRDPLTPALAADHDGVVLDLDALLARVRDLGRGADVVLVEGAGGVASPITWDRDITHVARALDARILLVGADRLGVLSHVKTTLHYLADDLRRASAIVLSAPTLDSSTGTNAASLARSLAAYGEVSGRIVTLAHGAVSFDAAALAALDRWVLGRAAG